MEQQIMHYLNALQEDSQYFVDLQKEKFAQFNPYDMEAPLANEGQREIRWHVNAINLFNNIINENRSLKRQIMVLQDSIGALRQNWVQSEQRFMEELDKFHVEAQSIEAPIGESSRVINPNIKLIPPIFDPARNPHPMQYISALQNYLEAVHA